jgi:Glycosyl transferase family 2
VINELERSLTEARRIRETASAVAPARWVTAAPPGEMARLCSGCPKVSIITPSLNQARFLEQTIQSVLDQRYPNLEYVVIDGGSMDGSIDIIKKHAGSLAYWVSEPDRGQADALNRGMARATGDILAWINSDDFYYPGAIDGAVAAFSANPDLGFVYGRGNRVNDAAAVITEFSSTRPFDLDALVHGVDYILQPTTFMRRQALHEAGPFDESLHYTFDWDMWMRLGRRFPAAMIDRMIAASREYASTKTASGGFRRTEEIRQLIQRHTGRELSVGYLNYLMSTVLETLPGAELPQRARLEGAVTALLSVCQELLGEDHLRERLSDKALHRYEIKPYRDGWVPPELRLQRVLPPTGAFLCLSGVHDRGVADVAGPLTLRTSLNGQLLGMSVIVAPGPFTVCCPVPEAMRDGLAGRSCEVEVVTATAVVPSRFGISADARAIAFRDGDVSFRADPPPGADLMSDGLLSATTEVVRTAVRTDAANPAWSGWPARVVKTDGDVRPDAEALRPEVPLYEDGWTRPELRLHRVLPPGGGYLCLSGIHDQGVADVAGPLTLRTRLNGQPLGMSVIVAPGPFTVCCRVPEVMRDEWAGRSCEVAVVTAIAVIPSRFGLSADVRAIAFRDGDVSFRADPPPGADLMSDGLLSATAEVVRTAVRADAANPGWSGWPVRVVETQGDVWSDAQTLRPEIPPYEDGWARSELRLHRVLPPGGGYLCLSGIHDQGVADVAGPLTLRMSLNGLFLGMSVIVAPGPFTVCWRVSDPMQAEWAGRPCEVAVVTAIALIPSRFWQSADPRSVAFRYGDLKFAVQPPPGADVVADGMASATDAVMHHAMMAGHQSRLGWIARASRAVARRTREVPGIGLG